LDEAITGVAEAVMAELPIWFARRFSDAAAATELESMLMVLGLEINLPRTMLAVGTSAVCMLSQYDST
jgi:hypothetical protein